MCDTRMWGVLGLRGKGQTAREVASEAQREGRLPSPDHPRDFLDFTGGTEDKWISQVNKPVLKNLLKKSI